MPMTRSMEFRSCRSSAWLSLERYSCRRRRARWVSAGGHETVWARHRWVTATTPALGTAPRGAAVPLSAAGTVPGSARRSPCFLTGMAAPPRKLWARPGAGRRRAPPAGRARGDRPARPTAPPSDPPGGSARGFRREERDGSGTRRAGRGAADRGRAGLGARRRRLPLSALGNSKLSSQNGGLEAGGSAPPPSHVTGPGGRPISARSGPGPVPRRRGGGGEEARWALGARLKGAVRGRPARPPSAPPQPLCPAGARGGSLVARGDRSAQAVAAQLLRRGRSAAARVGHAATGARLPALSAAPQRHRTCAPRAAAAGWARTRPRGSGPPCGTPAAGRCVALRGVRAERGPSAGRGRAGGCSVRRVPCSANGAKERWRGGSGRFGGPRCGCCLFLPVSEALQNPRARRVAGRQNWKPQPVPLPALPVPVCNSGCSFGYRRGCKHPGGRKEPPGQRAWVW